MSKVPSRVSKVGYMCMIDFDHDLEGDMARVYKSVDRLKSSQNCADDCGIVKVSVEVIEMVHGGTGK
jgi:hypothetical protein